MVSSLFSFGHPSSLLTRFELDAEHIKGKLRKAVDDQKCSSPHNSSVVGRGVLACFHRGPTAE